MVQNGAKTAIRKIGKWAKKWFKMAQKRQSEKSENGLKNGLKWPKNGNLYDSKNFSAFKFSHFALTFLRSILAWHFSENYGSVTFSENRKSMMSYHRDFPVD